MRIVVKTTTTQKKPHSHQKENQAQLSLHQADAPSLSTPTQPGFPSSRPSTNRLIMKAFSDSLGNRRLHRDLMFLRCISLPVCLQLCCMPPEHTKIHTHTSLQGIALYIVSKGIVIPNQSIPPHRGRKGLADLLSPLTVVIIQPEITWIC